MNEYVPFLIILLVGVMIFPKECLHVAEFFLAAAIILWGAVSQMINGLYQGYRDSRKEFWQAVGLPLALFSVIVMISVLYVLRT